MKLRIASGDLYISAWMESFIETTVQFAIWHASPSVEQVNVHFTRTPFGEVGCHLHAWRSDGSTARESAWHVNSFEAIQKAAGRLEVALFTPRNDDTETTSAAMLAA